MKNFFRVPNKIFSLGLNSTQFKLLCYLLRRCSNDCAQCYPSVNTVARDCCVSPDTARRTLHSLEAMKLIEINATISKTNSGAYRSSNNLYIISSKLFE